MAGKLTANKVKANQVEAVSKFGVGGVTAATQASKISDPTGGATTDTQARAAINSIIDVLERFGLSASS